ncbi:MAG: hypothetical protein RXO24_02800 [Acidilobus sp.]
MATGSPRPLGHLYSREYLLSRGGWRDLNYAEDFELWLGLALTTTFL